MTSSVDIRTGSAADIELLEPLWLGVHRQHIASMPQLAPYVDDATSWTARAALYRQLLGGGDSVLLIAETGGTAIGYGLAHVVAAADSFVLDDTWVTGARIGEIESLGVLPSHRNRGIGGRLLEGLMEELAGRGIADVVIGLLAGNEAALRLYRRHGFDPTWLYVSRFAARGTVSRPPSPPSAGPGG
jgi:ribosomal protein S18 acetylase RimI-like enzyme